MSYQWWPEFSRYPMSPEPRPEHLARLEAVAAAARAYREAARVQVGALDGTLRSETRWAVAHLARCQAQDRLFAALAALEAGAETPDSR